MRKSLLLVIILFGFSCKQSEENVTQTIGEVAIEYDSLLIEKINLPLVNTSFDGSFIINGDLINYIDRQLGWVYIFNKDGELVEKKLGRGQGPSEVSTSYLDGYFISEEGDYIFLGSSFDVHVHDKDFQRKTTFRLGWTGEQDQEKVSENPLDYVDKFALYTIDYQNLHLKIDYNGNVFIPIYSENDGFNMFSGDRYIEEGRILAKLNLKSGTVENIYGRRSDLYLEKKNLPHHAWFRYDVSKNGKIFINHEIDETIYVYDKDFVELYRFGFQGKNMNTNYQELSDFDIKKFRQLYFEDRPKRGWYSTIKVFEEKDLLFRSYKKGEDEEFDGLQVYRGVNLIADVPVPKGFEVIGYSKPYFYGQVIVENEEPEEFNLFKFKL